MSDNTTIRRSPIKNQNGHGQTVRLKNDQIERNNEKNILENSAEGDSFVSSKPACFALSQKSGPSQLESPRLCGHGSMWHVVYV